MLSVNSISRGLLICLLFTGCGDKAKEAAAPVGHTGPVPEEGRQIESYLSEAAKVKGKLTAPYMLRYQRADTPYAEFPRSLHVDFYNDSMRIESQLDALYGKYLQNQNKVYLRDSVVVKNILKGDTLHCKELWWDQTTQKFTTDKPVAIYTKEKILFGTGMEADQNFRFYTIKHLTGSTLMAEGAATK